jgi:hypothetical protein
MARLEVITVEFRHAPFRNFPTGETTTKRGNEFSDCALRLHDRALHGV